MKLNSRLLGLALGFAGLCTSTLLAAQPAGPADDPDLKAILGLMRSDANAFKIETLNRVMGMTGPEAERFWPVYQAYEKDLATLEDKGLGILREFLELQAAGTPDDKRWNSLARKWLVHKKARLSLWEKYQSRIGRAVSPYRAAQFLQVEHQMRLFLDLNIAQEMPVISTRPRSELLPSADVPTREESARVTVTAQVEAIDLAKREVTLKGPLGNATTFLVDERVRRLDQVRVGDTVRADYYISVAGELRPPTPEEQAQPLLIIEGAGRVPPGARPAGGALRLIRAVCTLEGLNRVEKTVTLQGPLGRLLTVGSADPGNLTRLRIGETVVVTYTEALAVSLEKID